MKKENLRPDEIIDEQDWREEEDSDFPRKGIYRFFNVHVIFLVLLPTISPP